VFFGLKICHLATLDSAIEQIFNVVDFLSETEAVGPTN
jgi:hypothetical protein